ncbi:hypothetical protein ACFQZ1_09925 [Bacillus sp. CGMCC 1.60114]
MNERPLLVLGIRYALFSTIIAIASGIWMIVLQSRYTGEAGNLIICDMNHNFAETARLWFFLFAARLWFFLFAARLWFLNL